jgi:hypothetical protein
MDKQIGSCFSSINLHVLMPVPAWAFPDFSCSRKSAFSIFLELLFDVFQLSVDPV